MTAILRGILGAEPMAHMLAVDQVQGSREISRAWVLFRVQCLRV